MSLRLFLVATIILFTITGATSVFGQIYGPEGLNMPGGYNSWSNPPTVNALAGIEKSGGMLLRDTNLAVKRYTTMIHVDSTSGDVKPGTFPWLFTSGPSGGYFNNKWAGVTVAFNTVQSYTWNTGSDNTVTLVQGMYYAVNYQDIGYAATKAVWMPLSALPVAISGVSQLPLPGNVTPSVAVNVSVTLAATPSPEEYFFVRYTTDGWVSSALLPVSVTGTTGTATIPGAAGGTLVSYYILSSTVASPASDVDLVTIRYNTNGGVNYNYSVTAPVYTITSSAVNGTIAPSGQVVVNAGDNAGFAYSPDAGFELDSLLVDNVVTNDSTSHYTFLNVQLNHSIRAVFVKKVDVTFAVNMSRQIRAGNFRPDSGDVVTIRGTFDGWNNADTMTDGNLDSIYTKTVHIPVNQPVEFKFWKSDRNGHGWEVNGNRAATIGTTDTLIGPLWFDNDAPSVLVTFRVNMGIKMQEGVFRPASGDAVLLRGSFNSWDTSDTLRDVDNDSVYTLQITLSGLQPFEYKFWKSDTGNGYEQSIGNRTLTTTLGDSVLPIVFFDNQSSALSALQVTKGWNLISLPRRPANGLKTVLFPAAISRAFNYATSYHPQDTLASGTGYWIKFPDTATVTISGQPVAADTIPVVAGWNLVGTPTVQVMTSGVVSTPASIINSRFFAYQGRYVPVDTLLPGKGYWIKASQPGSFLLSSGTMLRRTTPVNPQEPGDILTITDASGISQTLHFGRGSRAGSDLPPLPPDGAFDVRFAAGQSDVFFEGKTVDHPIRITGTNGGVVISWQRSSADFSATLVSGGKETVISGSGTLRLAAGTSGVTLRLAEGNTLPAAFALEPNTPNPFNPATTIRYAVPEAAHVSVSVYTLLGQKVVDLVNTDENPGWKTVRWDAGSLATGMYLVRFSAVSAGTHPASFTETRKILLMK
jgi:hypothetical protein